MPFSTLLFIDLLIFLIGALPSWPYSRGWGFAPSAIIGLFAFILILLVLLGRARIDDRRAKLQRSQVEAGRHQQA